MIFCQKALILDKFQGTMVGKIISEYLTGSNRSITIPGFGSFIRRESGDVVFTEILRTDDGTLNKEIQKKLKVTTEKAAIAIDNYVGFIRDELQARKNISIEGLGYMQLGRDGRISLTHQPNVKGGTYIAADNILTEKKLYRKETILVPVEEEIPVAEKEKASESKVTASRSRKVAAKNNSGNDGVNPGAVKNENRVVLDDADEQRQGIAIRRKKRKKVDMVIIIAILATLIGLAVLAYGFLAEKSMSEEIILFEP